MRKNYGKDWEDKFKSQWRSQFPRNLIYRLKDDMSGYKGSGTNPCDFICHINGKVLMVEVKCHYDNTFPWSAFRQLDELAEYSEFDGVITGVLIWFIDHKQVVFATTDTCLKMRSDGLKSINIRKLDGYNIIRVPSETKRVFPVCDLKVLEELANEGEDTEDEQPCKDTDTGTL